MQCCMPAVPSQRFNLHHGCRNTRGQLTLPPGSSIPMLTPMTWPLLTPDTAAVAAALQTHMFECCRPEEKRDLPERVGPFIDGKNLDSSSYANVKSQRPRLQDTRDFTTGRAQPLQGWLAIPPQFTVSNHITTQQDGYWNSSKQVCWPPGWLKFEAAGDCSNTLNRSACLEAADGPLQR